MICARTGTLFFRLKLPVLLTWVVVLSQQPVAAQNQSYRPPVDTAQLPLVKGGKAKNVILLIGDGMSLATIAAARIRATGTTGKLHMDRMPIAGFVRTSSADGLITDSAAASTAMATGSKTNNGMLAVTPDGRSLTTVLELCRDSKMATGLVATSSITHATPAGFGSHVPRRADEAEIARQLLQSRVNVLLGGGRAFFAPATQAGSRRTDSVDLISQAKAAGYVFVENRSDLLKANQPFLLGLFSPEGMVSAAGEPSLAEMAAQAIGILARDREGFFLMIEGSQIDWANHENDLERSIRETLSFDLAIQKALDFAVRDRRTLVIMTADHETGGMTIAGGKLDGTGLTVGWANKGHNGGTVPLYAYGPGAERFSGFHENTDIARVIAEVLALRALSPPVNYSAPASGQSAR